MTASLYRGVKASQPNKQDQLIVAFLSTMLLLPLIRKLFPYFTSSSSSGDAKPLNLMHDRRVVRGNTYSTVVVTQVANRPQVRCVFYIGIAKTTNPVYCSWQKWFNLHKLLQVKPSEQGAGPLIRRSQGPLGRGPLGLNAHRKPEPRRRGRLSGGVGKRIHF